MIEISYLSLPARGGLGAGREIILRSVAFAGQLVIRTTYRRSPQKEADLINPVSVSSEILGLSISPHGRALT